MSTAKIGQRRGNPELTDELHQVLTGIAGRSRSALTATLAADGYFPSSGDSSRREDFERCSLTERAPTENYGSPGRAESETLGKWEWAPGGQHVAVLGGVKGKPLPRSRRGATHDPACAPRPDDSYGAERFS